MPPNPLPLPVDATPEPVDADLECLLDEPAAGAWARGAAASAPAATAALRGRLLARAAASSAEARAMFTARPRRLPAVELACGVLARTLYEAQAGRALRAGEPLRARLIELPAGARWAGPEADRHREWLVLGGAVRIGGETLAERDYHRVPAGITAPPLLAEADSLLYVRESALPAASGDAPATVRDAEAGWPELAPGIRRRVLWQRDGQAAMLYNAAAGAAVPLHTHGHDEECLMLQGELFLDDVLLRAGDWQLAPAGTGHRVTATDTGVVVWAHGDLEFRFGG